MEVPRLVFINKLDRYGADPFLVLEQIRKKLGLTVQPIQLPIGEEDNFQGVCDVIARKIDALLAMPQCAPVCVLEDASLASWHGL
eukprot:4215694-Amphidinium_carterae.1